jgi:hypothetical protein
MYSTEVWVHNDLYSTSILWINPVICSPKHMEQRGNSKAQFTKNSGPHSVCSHSHVHTKNTSKNRYKLEECRMCPRRLPVHTKNTSKNRYKLEECRMCPRRLPFWNFSSVHLRSNPQSLVTALQNPQYLGFRPWKKSTRRMENEQGKHGRRGAHHGG